MDQVKDAGDWESAGNADIRVLCLINSGGVGGDRAAGGVGDAGSAGGPPGTPKGR